MDLVGQCSRANLCLKGTNLSKDNLYTELKTAETLYEMGITTIGTFRSNRSGIPSELKTVEGRDINSHITLYNSDIDNKKTFTLTSYVVNSKSKGKKNVLLLSTHSVMDASLKNTQRDKSNRPQVVCLYNFTKGGTDIFDQRIKYRSTAMKSRRWTMTAFCFLLDAILVNTITVKSINGGKDPRNANTSKEVWDLIRILVGPYVYTRSEKGLKLEIRLKRALYLGSRYGEQVILLKKERTPPAQGNRSFIEENKSERKQCKQCYLEVARGPEEKKEKKNLGKLKYKCQKCGDAVCLNEEKNHVLIVCQPCARSRDMPHSDSE